MLKIMLSAVAIVLLITTDNIVFAATEEANDAELIKILPPAGYRDLTIERYVADALDNIQKYAEDKTALRPSDYDRLAKEEQDNMRRQQVAQFIRFDQNFDGLIDAQEIEQSFEKKRPDNERQIKSIMAFDANKDSKVTYSEMSVLDEEKFNASQQNRQSKRIAGLLKLDRNNDKILDKAELEHFARQAFSSLDADGNGFLSSEEYRAVEEKQRAARIEESEKRKFDSCVLPQPIPSDVTVYAVGGDGGKKSEYAIDGSGSSAIFVDVIVNQPGKKVALLLGAYNPTVWQIRTIADTKIAAILASGYRRQIIANADKSIPTLVYHAESDNDNHSNGQTCGGFYLSESKMNEINPISRKLFGKPVELMYLAKDNQVVIGDENFDKEKLVGEVVDISKLKVPGSSPAGEKGIEEGIKNGFLRLPNENDIHIWNQEIKKLREKSMVLRGAPFIYKNEDRLSFPMKNSLIVIKDNYIIPSDISIKDRPIFIVAKGVKLPKNNPSMIKIFDMNNLQCSNFMVGNSEKCLIQ